MLRNLAAGLTDLPSPLVWCTAQMEQVGVALAAAYHLADFQ